MMVVTAREFAALLKTDPFSGDGIPKSDGAFITVVENSIQTSMPLPIGVPQGNRWQVQIVGSCGPFVASVRRKGSGTQLYSNQVVEKLFRVSATTRGWPTFLKIQQQLKAL